MVEDLCHRRAWSVSLAVTQQFRFALSRQEDGKFEKQEVNQPEVHESNVCEQDAEPLQALCVQPSALTSLKDKTVTQLRDQYCIQLLICFGFTASD